MRRMTDLANYEPRPLGRGCCRINRHRFTLLLHYIANRRPQSQLTVKIPGTSMTGPSLRLWRIQVQLVQLPARIRFQIIQNLFRRIFPLQNRMRMIRPHVNGINKPASKSAGFQHCGQNCIRALKIQNIGPLVYGTMDSLRQMWVYLYKWIRISIFLTVHNPVPLAGKMRTKSCKSEQVVHIYKSIEEAKVLIYFFDQHPLPNGRGSFEQHAPLTNPDR